AWLSGPLLRCVASALALLERRTEALESLEQRISDLGRIAGTLERRPLAESQIATEAAARLDAPSDIRAAIQAFEWARADELLRALLDAHPGHPEATVLTRERDEALSANIEALRAKVNSAREVNDPDRALELRDVLVPLLDADSL